MYVAESPLGRDLAFGVVCLLIVVQVFCVMIHFLQDAHEQIVNVSDACERQACLTVDASTINIYEEFYHSFLHLHGKTTETLSQEIERTYQSHF